MRRTPPARATARAVAVAVAVLAAACALFPAAAAAGARPRYGGTVRVLLPSPPSGVDPARAVDTADLQVARALGATLLEPGSGTGGARGPGLLEAAPEQGSGGRAWRLRLAPALRFQDGTPITASEVAASLSRLAGPASLHAWLMAPIEGALAVREGRATSLAGIETLGEHEVRVTLTHPYPQLAAALATAPAAIVRALPGGGLVGAGPFRLLGGASAAGELAADAFDGHHAGRPFADRVAFEVRGPPGTGRRARVPSVELTTGPQPGAAGAAITTAPLNLVLAIVSPRMGTAAAPTRLLLASLDRADLARSARGGGVPLGALLPAALLPPVEAAAPPTRRAPVSGVPARLQLLFEDDLASGGRLRSLAARIQLKLHERGVRTALEGVPAHRLAARLARRDYEAALVSVRLVSPDAALSLAQIAGALGGPTHAAAALEAVAGDPGPAGLALLQARLEEELLAVPLWAASERVITAAGVEGVALRSDGTVALEELWLSAGVSGGPG